MARHPDHGGTAIFQGVYRVSVTFFVWHPAKVGPRRSFFLWRLSHNTGLTRSVRGWQPVRPESPRSCSPQCLAPHPKPSQRFGFDLSPRERAGRGEESAVASY
jgi:hypothetical protein